MRTSPSSVRRRTFAVGGVALVTAGLVVALGSVSADARPSPDRSGHTASPIKHVVVIYDENESYDHYFGTYPYAANTDGTHFTASKHTPRNDNLVTSGMLTHNPNLYPPRRLASSQASTCDQNHQYTAEQKAVNDGHMDKFVQNVSVDTCTGLYGAPGLSMDYFDGNTVTAMWNYAQHYAMSDNSWDVIFGPSTPGAINLVSGQTHGFVAVDSTTLQPVSGSSSAVTDTDAHGVGTMITDPDPAYDDCSDSNHTSTNDLAMSSGKNIGDLLNAKGVTWGWFQGGFRPTTAAGNGSYAVCGTSHTNLAGASVVDYSPHHNPFEYYKSTSNPHHLPPSSVRMIGKTDQANHNYDLSDFDTALNSGVLPAVSFLKAPSYQDGHAGYSDPIDEQHFLVSQINALQKSKFWSSTAVVIAYDDSDGWYDHVAPKITNASHSATNDVSTCSSSTAPVLGGYQDRCGPSQRLPMLIISPYAKTNYVSHTLVSQPSILSFIEDNWRTGRIGRGSFDQTASARNFADMFDFRHPDSKRVLLNQNGSVDWISSGHGHHS